MTKFCDNLKYVLNFSILPWRVFYRVPIGSENSYIYCQSQGQTNHIGQSDDVESDGDIRFLICLRISDKILGYILH